MATKNFSESVQEKLRLIATILIDGAIACTFLAVAYAIKWLSDGSDIAGTTIIVVGEIGAIVMFVILVASEVAQLFSRKRAEVIRCQLDTSKEISASQAEIDSILSSVDTNNNVNKASMHIKESIRKKTDQTPELSHNQRVLEMSALPKEAVGQIATGIIRLCREISTRMNLSDNDVFIDEARLSEAFRRTRNTVEGFLLSTEANGVSVWRLAGVLVYWLAKLRPITVLTNSGDQIHPLNELVAHALALKYFGHVDMSKMEPYVNSQVIWTLQYQTTDPMALGILYRFIFDQYGDQSSISMEIK